MTNVLFLKLELLGEVNEYDPREMSFAQAEADEIERQVMEQVRRLHMGKRWRLKVFDKSEWPHATINGEGG